MALRPGPNLYTVRSMYPWVTVWKAPVPPRQCKRLLDSVGMKAPVKLRVPFGNTTVWVMRELWPSKESCHNEHEDQISGNSELVSCLRLSPTAILRKPTSVDAFEFASLIRGGVECPSFTPTSGWHHHQSFSVCWRFSLA